MVEIIFAVAVLLILGAAYLVGERNLNKELKDETDKNASDYKAERLTNVWNPEQGDPAKPVVRKDNSE